MPLINSRKEAISNGLSRYFTGKPCKHGHVAERYVCGGCVECVTTSAAAWHAANPAKVKEKHRRYCEAHPDKRREKDARRYSPERREKTLTKDRERRLADPEKHRGAVRRWQSANRDKAAAASRAWYRKNREHIIASLATLRANDPIKFRERSKKSRWKNINSRREYERLHSSKRRALKLNSEIEPTRDMLALPVKRIGKCPCCGKVKKLTIDHVKPLSKGGAHGKRNMQLLCSSCNSAKNNKDSIIFMQSRGFLL